MSIIGFNSVVAAYKKGTTYGTEADITSGGVRLFASSMNPTGGFADRVTRDFGQGGKRRNNARGAASFDFSMTFELTHWQAWMGLFAGLMGTESTPAEVTTDEDDYLINFDVADATEGLFYTVVYSMETDRVMVIPSFTPTSATIDVPLNGAGTVTINGVADDVKESSSNTVAEITALTPYFYEEVTFGGANQYSRFADYSTDTALDSGDDKDLSGFTLTFNRAKERRYGNRGALSAFTKEPLQLGLLDVTLQVRLSELDNAGLDALAWWRTPDFKMGEIYIDGSQINAGVNRSLKFQFPYLKAKGSFPDGHGVASNNGLFQPSLVFDCLKTDAAPSGMTGVTDLLRLVAVGPDRTTKWGT